MSQRFIHLHVHSEYSLIDSVVRINDLLNLAVEYQMPAVALTDLCNLFATVKFYQAAIAKGIKPIIGAEVLIQDKITNKINNLIFLCKNNVGYYHLTKLLSKAYLSQERLDNNLPLIQTTWLNNRNTDGLIAIFLNVDISAAFGKLIINNNYHQAKQYLDFWLNLFKNNFYIALTQVGNPQEYLYLAKIIPFANQYNIPVIATNNVKFLKPDDFDALEARVCINNSEILADPKRVKNYTNLMYFKSPQAIAKLFDNIPVALHNTWEIAKQCNVFLEFGKTYLPDFPIPSNYTEKQYLENLADTGLKKRFAELKIIAERDQRHYNIRLHQELSVINSMGFAGYFLIVADFINWAKINHIPVGPGRGSGAGSVVAYALGITDLDPLAYDLLFERFLNPERVSMPDFDIDFCIEGRDKVIEYVAKKYGKQSVAQIATFGTMAAKAVVRDVGRILGHPYTFVDKIAKLIPFEIGMTLNQALEQEEELYNRYHNEEDVKSILDLSLKLEGLCRNIGKHAGGVVISPGDINKFSALYCEAEHNSIVTQFDKDDVEAMGLIKFDFLGLKNLTIIHKAIININKKRQANNLPNININNIDLKDLKTFKLLQLCKTTAIFQLESSGMKDLIKRLQPDSLDDIIALVALFRPGPLQSGMVDDFIERKRGKAPVSYLHAKLEPILAATYGVILYQEQVMQIAQSLANYTLGGADLLRRAMGKKKPEEMAKQREIFLTGAKNNNIEHNTASNIFNLMEKFAGYGFNKSHSAAYGLISYQTAWLKANYPSDFMAAVMTADMDHTDKICILVEDSKSLDITVLAPDINLSNFEFTVKDVKNIYYGLGAIKGVGGGAIDIILAAREQQQFKNLFDFCQRVDLRKVNRRVIEALVKSGAMDGFNISRSILFASIDKAIKLAEKTKLNQITGQTELFTNIATNGNNNTDYIKDYITVPPWTNQQTLWFEKETLGMFFSGHPLDDYLVDLKNITSCNISNIFKNKYSKYQELVIGGLITNLKKIRSKTGKNIIIVTLHDKTEFIEFSLFDNDIIKYKNLLQKDKIIIASGTIMMDKFTNRYRLRVKSLFSLLDAKYLKTKKIILNLSEQLLQAKPDVVNNLYNLLAEFPHGKVGFEINYCNNLAKTKLLLPAKFNKILDENLLLKLTNLVYIDNIKLCY